MRYEQRPPGRFEIDQQRGETIHNVAGDQTINVAGSTIDVLPSPAGRLVILLGVLVIMAGFAAFAYPVVTFILTIFDSIQSQQAGPPDLSQVHFAPWIPLGMAAEMAGVLLLIAGALLRRRRR